MKNISDLVARILIAGVFMYEAVDSIIFFGETKESMTAYGIEWNQNLLLVGAIVLLFLGGSLILLGYRMGLGGVLAFSVGSRVREFGIRSALGAAQHQVWSRVLGEGAVLAGLGLGFGR